ncbi:MAG: hypothetical protein WC554_13755 [Clostridia bacterium]
MKNIKDLVSIDDTRKFKTGDKISISGEFWPNGIYASPTFDAKQLLPDPTGPYRDFPLFPVKLELDAEVIEDTDFGYLYVLINGEENYIPKSMVFGPIV